MRSTTAALVFGSVLCTSSAGIAQIGATDTSSCASHLSTSLEKPTVGALLSCLAEMQRDLNELTNQLRNREPTDETVNTQEIPIGAVVAFDLPPTATEKQCPDGWTLFQPAGGRFVIGAGEHRNQDQNGELLSVYRGNPNSTREDLERHGNTLKTIGGAETHTLTEAEAPPHIHQSGRYDNSGNYVSPNSPADGTKGTALRMEHDWNGSGNAQFSTDAKGGGQPHNNMPPYIALYFCKKA